MIGTPGYIAPEQVEHGSAGPASDVFALGGLLLHAATGRPPFGEGGAAVVLYRVLHTDPDLRGVPPELVATVAACLQRDPRADPTRTPWPPASPVGFRCPLPRPTLPCPPIPRPAARRRRPAPRFPGRPRRRFRHVHGGAGSPRRPSSWRSCSPAVWRCCWRRTPGAGERRRPARRRPRRPPGR